jgi:hypothetical protein
MTSNFNLRIQKQAWFHCDVKLSQTCPIRSHKRARFYKETTLSFHLLHVYNSVRVSVLLLYYKTIDISEWKVKYLEKTKSCTVRVTGFSVCTCRKCVPFVAYTIWVTNTHKKDETFKMVRILRGNIIYDHLL